MPSEYLIGTQVEGKNGRIRVKVATSEGSAWISLGRQTYIKAFKKELEPNQRVFYIDGDSHNNKPSNLTMVTFSGVRYSLKHSRVIYSPKPLAKAKPYIPKVYVSK